MRTFVLLMVSMSLVTGSAVAVVGGPEAPEDGVAITSGSSSSATASVSENGTEWRSNLENRQSSCMTGNSSTGVNVTETSEGDEGLTVSFEGSVGTANPCATLESDVEKLSDDSYRMTLAEVPGDGACTECIGVRQIRGNLTADQDYRIELVKDNETLDTAETDNYNQEKEPRGLWQKILSFLGF